MQRSMCFREAPRFVSFSAILALYRGACRAKDAFSGAHWQHRGDNPKGAVFAGPRSLQIMQLDDYDLGAMGEVRGVSR